MAPSPASVSGPPIPVAAALVRQEGRYLVTLRRSGLWEFPGGKREPGESFPQALAREMMEELGLAVEVDRPFLTLEHTYPDRVVELHFYWCTLARGRPQCLGCREWRWAAVAEMEELEFLAADREVIARLKEEEP